MTTTSLDDGDSVASDDSDSIESDDSDDGETSPSTLSPNSPVTPIGDGECCICLEKIRLPLVLPCRHQFCYLCLKAAYQRNPACPLCRRRIPSQILETANISESQVSFNKVQDQVPVVWLYSGRAAGWWAYDPTISEEIEEHYQTFQQNPTESSYTQWILGRAYTIDFTAMEQRINGARRFIKRETQVSEIRTLAKGVAGMKLTPAS
jgi:hypothetical protein